MARSKTRAKSPVRKPRPARTPAAAAAPSRPASYPRSLVTAQLARVRKLCAQLAGVVERPSHGSPAFLVDGERAFAYFHDDHHGDGRLALWCAAPEGAQAMLVDADPEGYFLPPYVAHLGWIGVRLDRDLPWSQIAAVLEAGYQTRSAPRRAARRRGRTARSAPRIGQRRIGP